MADAVVSITDVVPDAVRISVRDLRVGDKVFDASGGTHTLTHVRTLKDGTVRTDREDGIRDWWQPTDTITIMRAE